MDLKPFARAGVSGKGCLAAATRHVTMELPQRTVTRGAPHGLHRRVQFRRHGRHRHAIALTHMLARERNARVVAEVFQHTAVAPVVIVTSRGSGMWIPRMPDEPGARLP
jgi:hypothetical protein